MVLNPQSDAAEGRAAASLLGLTYYDSSDEENEESNDGVGGDDEDDGERGWEEPNGTDDEGEPNLVPRGEEEEEDEDGERGEGGGDDEHPLGALRDMRWEDARSAYGALQDYAVANGFKVLQGKASGGSNKVVICSSNTCGFFLRLRCSVAYGCER
jgi:hypothetical protein